MLLAQAQRSLLLRTKRGTTPDVASASPLDDCEAGAAPREGSSAARSLVAGPSLPPEDEVDAGHDPVELRGGDAPNALGQECAVDRDDL